jgi:very-short-patch-repair endonuclease
MDEHVASDRLRDKNFERQGFKILRVWNSDVDANLDGVLAVIDLKLRENAPTRSASPTTLPLAGEG